MPAPDLVLDEGYDCPVEYGEPVFLDANAPHGITPELIDDGDER